MNILSKFHLPSSSGLGLTVFGRYFHKPWLTYWINGKGVCRTVPATPGLLIIIIDRILARLSENPKSSFRLRRWKSSKLIKLCLVLCENTLQRRSVTKWGQNYSIGACYFTNVTKSTLNEYWKNNWHCFVKVVLLCLKLPLQFIKP